MQQEFVNINGIPVNVCTWGRWITEKPKTSDQENIILLIPGNPGVLDFYNVFLKTLYEKHKWPVWVIGNTGHEEPEGEINPVYNDPAVFGLKGQIQHKVNFIKKYVPENARLHLIGFSMGSYFVLQLLKDPDINQRVVKNYLLFPVFERMWETRNGKIFMYGLRYILWFLIFLLRILFFLPVVIRNFLLYKYLTITGISHWQGKAILTALQPESFQRSLSVGFEAIENITARDDKTIRENQSRMIVLYGNDDGWCPKQFFQEFKRDHPTIHVDTTDIEHMFVLNNSVEVAKIVSDWIKGEQ